MEVVDSVTIRGQQSFAKYNQLNLIEIKIEGVINILKNKKNATYRFVPTGLPFSSSTKNNTEQIFIAANGLNKAKGSLLKRKILKIYSLGVINLNQVNIWDNTKKGVWNWTNKTFDELKSIQKTDHFAFSFKTRNLNDLLTFQFTFLDSNNKKVEFIDNEKKITILNFRTEVLK